MEVLFVLGIAQSLFLCVLIVSQSKQFELAQRILVIWLMTIAANLIFYLVSFSNRTVFFELMICFWAVETLHGPLIYLYTRSVVDHSFRISRIHFLHGSFYLMAIGFVFYLHLFTDENVQMANGYLRLGPATFASLDIVIVLFRVVTIAYFLATLFELNKKRNAGFEFYSDIDKINLSWLKRFVLGIMSAYLLLYALRIDYWGFVELSNPQFASLRSSVFVILVFYTGYVNYMHQSDLLAYKPIKHDDSPDEFSSTRYKRTGLTDEKASQLKKRLLEVMTVERPFLLAQLTLPDLAERLHVSTNHLSQVINDRIQKNFFSFVNEYRVAEFKSRVEKGDHANYTLSAIALECGFNSKSSFYAVFKKLEGVTPSDYVKSVALKTAGS